MRTTLRQFIEFLQKLESGKIQTTDDELIYQTFIGNDTNTGYSIMEFYREPGGDWIMKDGSFKGLEVIL